jgi:hypothetical protein
MRNPTYRRALPWFGLLCILIVYALCVLWLKPANFFGLTEDDSIYFTSAQALADGRGYILPSMPDAPPATKYPVLYPWILSWIWWWNPSFPGNLGGALALNVAFGFAFISAAFLFFRKIGGLKNTESLILTAFCALHPVTLFYTANLTTEILFAALALGAIVFAGEVLRTGRGMAPAAGSGVVSGLSMLIRLFGIPLAAGLFLAILLRGSWRKAAGFAACAAPFLGIAVWRSIVVTPPAAPISASSCWPVWNMSWMYYSSYLSFWRANVLQGNVIWQMLKENLILLLIQPGSYFLNPHLVRLEALAFVIPVVLSAGVIQGYRRQNVKEGWGPVPYALALYCIPILLWDYQVVERFLIPFLPLIAAGLWMEGRYLIKRIRLSLRDSSLKTERPAALFLGAAVVAVVLSVGWFFWQDGVSLRRQSDLRGLILQEKREAYAWLRENSSGNSRVIAYEDAALFLYSGRQAMRPVIYAPAALIRADLLEAELSCMTEGARAIGASYWMISDDDFGFEWEPAISRGRAREREIEGVLPQVFRSGHGHVRIYSLGCARQSNEPACRSTSVILFPSVDGGPRP